MSGVLQLRPWVPAEVPVPDESSTLGPAEVREDEALGVFVQIVMNFSPSKDVLPSQKSSSRKNSIVYS